MCERTMFAEVLISGQARHITKGAITESKTARGSRTGLSPVPAAGDHPAPVPVAHGERCGGRHCRARVPRA